MIALRNGFLASSRKADAKISVLKDVIRRVQAGEEVDVEGILGTGDEAKEREWEEVLREIENEDALWQAKAKTARDQPRPNEGLHTPGELESQDSGSQKVNLEPNSSERLGDSAGTRIGRAEGSQSTAPRGFY
ncbi:MAG: hypothetical protein M1825_001251 [Sarcosagium campestre]|nr:MAG: hypothetical protein M1825_001251 [Sarcosagium campestre]